MGEKQNKCKNFKQKEIQSELLKGLDDDEHRWLQCNTDAAKTAATFNLQEQMVETIR